MNHPVKVLFTVVCLLAAIVVAEVNCPRSEDLEAKEIFCWRTQSELKEILQDASQTVLNFAKRKLGMETDDHKEPVKCEYYQCILQELHMLNVNGYPVYSDIKTWAENHLTMSQGGDFINRLDICNEALSNSMVTNSYFDGSIGETGLSSSEDKSGTKCNVTAEFTKCLSLQAGCPVFKYP